MLKVLWVSTHLRLKPRAHLRWLKGRRRNFTSNNYTSLSLIKYFFHRNSFHKNWNISIAEFLPIPGLKSSDSLSVGWAEEFCSGQVQWKFDNSEKMLGTENFCNGLNPETIQCTTLQLHLSPSLLLNTIWWIHRSYTKSLMQWLLMLTSICW